MAESLVLSVAGAGVGVAATAAALPLIIAFTPVEIPLFPGHPMSELAWSEIRYDAYCFIEPR